MSRFSPQLLLAALRQFPSARRFWIAYSGGLDSHVLLHALTVIRGDLSADLNGVHINHGLSKDAGAWSRHCESVCSELGIPCYIFAVSAAPQSGESREAAARRARYAALAEIVQTGDCLLTAHHQDDQAETVLLQMLRGAGPRGLAAMPSYTEFSRGILGRPLLGFTRDDLHGYAVQEGLRWVDDQSNFDTCYQRNYLRREVVPLIKRRWPAMARILSRTAAHCADAAQMMDVIAASDFENIRGVAPDTISINKLLTLQASNQRNVLRFWFRQAGVLLPETVHLERLYSDVLNATEDRMPRLAWGGVEVRRYRDLLYLMSPPLSPVDYDQALVWDMRQTLVLPSGGGRLVTKETAGTGLKTELWQSQSITVRYRRGGEKCRPAGARHTRTVKNLFQEKGIPPWQRDRIPFIYAGDELITVAGLWICQPWQAGPGELGFEIEWQY